MSGKELEVNQELEVQEMKVKKPKAQKLEVQEPEL